ncbi:hypothetical protein F5887DRAFT_550757 [Amanita rubescens]|nr:hypothetical protein F5887DRAFT_550757 [Amanita rubescens]
MALVRNGPPLCKAVTSTHRVLSCPDLVNLICGQCDKATLTSLARTKRDISEITLDVLWRSIPDIGPLIRCMPEDLWEEREEPGKCIKLTLRRLILSTDWERFEINAMRIRQLGVTDPSVIEYVLGIDVYGALACASVGRTPLLPRLVTIRWTPQADVEYPYIGLFLSSYIQSLALDITGKSDPATSVKVRLSLLPRLVSVCPHISHLTLCNKYGLNKPRRQEIENALSAIRQWSSLRSLEMGGLPDLSTLCVAKFPVLRKLVVGNPHETTEEWLTSGELLAMRAKGFTKLEHLDIRFSTVEFLARLFSCMSGTPLRTLRLEFGRDPERNQLSELFMAMRRGIAHSSLQHLRISYDRSRTELVQEDRFITLAELSPLLAFTYLSEVSIAINYDICIGTEDLQVVALKWPHLQTLEFISLRPSDYWPQITIKDVVRHFPSLENLTISFDASEVCLTNAERPGDGVRNEKLCNLGVLRSPIDEPGNVAALLSDIVPNLRLIDVFQYDEGDVPNDFEELERKWKEAERYVALFSLVRMQERMGQSLR